MKRVKYALATLCTAACIGQAQALEISFSESAGFGVASDRVQINDIRVDTVIANPFDPSRPEIYSLYYDVPFRFDPASLHLVPDLSGAVPDNNNRLCADLTVEVQDAMTGTALNNAIISVEGQSAVTVNGTASFSGLSSGLVNIVAALADYASDDLSTELACGANSLGIALNPTTGDNALAANEVRVILSWGEEPYDLDSHLTGPQPGLAESYDNEANRFHAYYVTDGSSDGVAVLDVDDTTSYGPETITISPPAGTSTLRPGIYRYSVHHYAGANTMADARVKLLIGNSTERTFTPNAAALAGDDDVWTVFELNVGSTGQVTVLDVDSYSHGMYEGDVRNGPHGAPESRKLFPQGGK